MKLKPQTGFPSLDGASSILEVFQCRLKILRGGYITGKMRR